MRGSEADARRHIGHGGARKQPESLILLRRERQREIAVHQRRTVEIRFDVTGAICAGDGVGELQRCIRGLSSHVVHARDDALPNAFFSRFD